MYGATVKNITTTFDNNNI